MKKLFFFCASCFFVLLFAANVSAAVYEVKPNTPLDTIAEVPWAEISGIFVVVKNNFLI